MSKLKRYADYLTVVLGLLFFLIFLVFPIYWLFISSLKPTEDLFLVPARLFPARISTENFVEVFTQTSIARYFLNSVITSVLVTALTMLVSVLGAYSLTKYRYPGRELISKLILLAYIFPGILILFPLHQLVVKLGVNNSLLGLIMANLTFTVPFSLWMLRAFFEQLPVSLEESAMIDGCNKFGAFLRVLLPLATPGILAGCVFAFILSWNEYMFALVFVTNDAIKTLPLGVAGFLGHLTIAWGLLLASAVTAVLPIVLVFMFFQRYLVQGISAGAVKG